MSFFKKKMQKTEEKPETESIFFNCPVYVNVFKKGFDEENGDEPTELSGPVAYEYIEDSVREVICEDFRFSELHRYFVPSGVVYGFSMEIVEDGLAVIKAEVVKGISKETENAIWRFIDGQMSDGWEKARNGIMLVVTRMANPTRFIFGNIKTPKLIINQTNSPACQSSFSGQPHV